MPASTPTSTSRATRFVQNRHRAHAGADHGLYENNRVTTSVGLGVNYAATAKISANARARYIRARLITTDALAPGAAAPTTTDKLTSLSLGANYAINRAWNLGCNVGHESRDVSGAATYSYTANTVGCQTQFIWQ